MEIWCQDPFFKIFVSSSNSKYHWNHLLHGGEGSSFRIKIVSAEGAGVTGIGESKYLDIVTSFNITLFYFCSILDIAPYPDLMAQVLRLRKIPAMKYI